MAEIIVNLVVNKLGEIILIKLSEIVVKEVELLSGVKGQVEHMNRELKRIQCCLKDADSKRRGDARVRNWLNELRDVAYRIEDATDTFLIRAEDHRPMSKRERLMQNISGLIKNTVEMPVLLHRLGTELGEIQKVLGEISKSRVDYGIKPLEDKDKEDAIILPLRRAVYEEVAETEIVGLDGDKNEIIKLLQRETTPRRAVVTIVGTGGLGKTTLAQMVYKSIRAKFHYHMMLSISQQFDPIDLLRKMLSKYRSTVPEGKDLGYYVESLRSLLCGRRYLIVLDDVWKVDVWNLLEKALPDDKNGSRVLMTSRLIKVARSAESEIDPYELTLLDPKDSLDLLLKKAVPNRECPSDLISLAVDLSQKCKGLPLALIVLGGILSVKELVYPEWERVLQTMDWNFDGEECMKVLAMSYEDMPYYLKACFLYLACFPEDYEISAKRLIRMWVAEGFIPQEPRKTMDETAEDCLNELFQRCMVQVSSRRMNGSIKYCRVHDLLRELAMHKACEENFVTVFSKEQMVNQSNNRTTRRASFQFYSDTRIVEDINPNTRSLLWFMHTAPNFSKFGLLKVLEFVGLRRDLDLQGLDSLIHLKYLGFRLCRNVRDSQSFTYSLASLRNLETLDVQHTDIDFKLDTIWARDTLRHVLCQSNYGPSSKYVLRNLQTLKWIQVNNFWGPNYPCMDNLRDLGLNSLSNRDWRRICTLLGTLPKLISLGIHAKYDTSYYYASFPKEIVYPRDLPNYANLQSLFLDGVWSKNVALDASLFPERLIKLTLQESHLSEDPLRELGKLKSLKKLSLRSGVYNGDEMVCAEGFPQLQYLQVQKRRGKKLKIMEGVMPQLKYLETSHLCKVQMPTELQHVIVTYKGIS